MALYGTYHDLSDLSTIREETNVEFPEEEEESFVMTSLLAAAEEGSVDAVSELMESASHFDVNLSNRHGETALHLAASSGHVDVMQLLCERGMNVNVRDKHGEQALFWAARQGHISAVQYLKDQCGLSLDAQNKVGEGAIHIAARYNHISVLQYLCDAGANVNLQDKRGDTVMHIVAWHSLPVQVCQMLCNAGCRVNCKNKDDETPLHCAAARNSIECLQMLIARGADVNVTDKRGCSPLHFAVRRRNVVSAIHLLGAGCQLDSADMNGETALHSAARDGLLSIVQTMCAYGCSVDVVNKNGMTPLHLSSKAGHIEVARCLLLSGASVDLPNKDGISAEIMSLANGQHEVAELLNKLRPDRHNAYIRQLFPTSTPLSRIKLKVFGSSGVGKSTLIESLKCGYFGNLLRKAGITSSTNMASIPQKGGNENGIERHRVLGTRICYEPNHVNYTRGIEVQQAALSGVGEMSLWEFSGYQPYYVVYDQFVGDVNCIHVVVVNLSDPRDVQLSQLLLWLHFIAARVRISQPIGKAGRSLKPVHVLVVGTHADCICAGNNSAESTADVLLQTVSQKFDDLVLGSKMFSVNALEAMSSDMKALRSAVSELKTNICQSLPTVNGFLDAAIAALPGWRKILPNYPVVSWLSFVEYIRATVNSLASDGHIRELVCQLQLVGEVVYIETEEVDDDDFVVLSPQWLGSEVIGDLLSHELTVRCRPTGCFTIDDFQVVLPGATADDVLYLLAALGLSTRCSFGDETAEHEVEHELPCLNFVETLAGLWDREDDKTGSELVYGGLRFDAGRFGMDDFIHVFPRVQVRLRRHFMSYLPVDPDCDLYQWFHGSKYCTGNGCEALITLEQDEQMIELKCRAAVAGDLSASDIYRFREELARVIIGTLQDCLPGVFVQVAYLSAVDLAMHDPSPYAYPSCDVLLALANETDTVRRVAGSQGVEEEKLCDLVAFRSDSVLSSLVPGLEMHVSRLPLEAQRQLCSLLDPADPTGRDWCLLAVRLGLSTELPVVEGDPDSAGSPTDRVLSLWSADNDATLSKLVNALTSLNRTDAVDAVVSTIRAVDEASAD